MLLLLLLLLLLGKATSCCCSCYSGGSMCRRSNRAHRASCSVVSTCNHVAAAASPGAP